MTCGGCAQDFFLESRDMYADDASLLQSGLSSISGNKGVRFFDTDVDGFDTLSVTGGDSQDPIHTRDVSS